MMDGLLALRHVAAPPPLRLALCDTPALRAAVYRFRYDIHVRLMRRRQVHADHARGTIEEPMDRDGRNYAALHGDEVVGTIRANAANDPTARYYAKLYGLADLWSGEPEHAQITTRLMIRPDLRNTMIGTRLLGFYGADSVARGMRLDVMDCNAPLIPMFERFGYHSYRRWVFHHEFGAVRPMFAAADTVRWYDCIGSPLGRAVTGAVVDDAHGGYDLVRRNATPPRTAALREGFRRFFGPPCPMR
jgi:hypothetical protein